MVMSFLSHGGRCATRLISKQARRSVVARHASRISIPAPAAFPVIEACPSATCACAEMPAGLDIDRELPLNGTMAAHAEQLLISTGRNDWKSKIEEEDDGVLVRQLRQYLGRGGKYSDPYNNIMITNSSFQASESRSGSASAFLLPSFQYVPSIATDSGSVEAFVRGFLQPSKLHASHDVLTREQKEMLLRQPEAQKKFDGLREVNEILVLICGHGGRDQRCGVLGPILQAEFEDKLERQNVQILRDGAVKADVGEPRPTARVGLISHIGGHKFAGNVIIYIPPSTAANALAGKGIWYGRVEPKHVEGIVAKTILDGRVIKEFFRGGIAQGGEILRL